MPWTLNRAELEKAKLEIGVDYPKPVLVAPEWNRHQGGGGGGKANQRSNNNGQQKITNFYSKSGEPQSKSGLDNMRDPGILDPRHFFFPRHFYTIYAIFTQFYAILHDFCAIFHDFCTILREFCDFYAIFCDFYAIFAIFTRFFAR